MRKKILLIMVIMLIGITAVTACSKEEKTKKSETDNKKEDIVEEKPVDKDWAKKAVFYEIFVRAFCDSDGDGTGDFNGITQNVDYLNELGINAVWLMPMMKTTTYHGYDVVDYKEVNPDYGTMDDFKTMLKTLHDNDIKVIIDYVANHTSNENEWFKEGIADVNSKYRNYYTFYTEKPQLTNMSVLRGNAEYKLYYIGYFDTIMPDLNYSNQDVRDDMKNVAKYWLDIGIDGFRLDGAMHIDDENKEVTYSWWREFTSYVKSINDSAFIVGENWDGNYKVIAPYYSTMDSSFDFPMATQIENMAKGGTRDYITFLNKQLEEYQMEADSEDSVVDQMVLSTMIGNHDLDRIADRLDGNIGMEKVAASLLFTMPGTPFIYYGDELGQLGCGSDAYKRESFDWYKSASGEGFVTNFAGEKTKVKFALPDDGISYEEESSDDNSLLSHYKNLISMRKANIELFDGEYTSLGINGDLYAYTCKGKDSDSTILIVHNLKDNAATFKLLTDGTDIYNNKDVKASDSYSLEGRSMLVLKYTGSDSPVDTTEFKSTTVSQ